MNVSACTRLMACAARPSAFRHPAAEPQAIAIAEAARRLVELRDRWLNPPESVEWVDEPVAGCPRRPVPRNEVAEKALKKRNLTNLYNARPQWLADAHAALDAAVSGRLRVASADITGWGRLSFPQLHEINGDRSIRPAAVGCPIMLTMDSSAEARARPEAGGALRGSLRAAIDRGKGADGGPPSPHRVGWELRVDHGGHLLRYLVPGALGEHVPLSRG